MCHRPSPREAGHQRGLLEQLAVDSVDGRDSAGLVALTVPWRRVVDLHDVEELGVCLMAKAKAKHGRECFLFCFFAVNDANQHGIAAPY